MNKIKFLNHDIYNIPQTVILTMFGKQKTLNKIKYTKEYTSWEYQWKKNHENSWHNLNQVYLRPSSNTEIFLSNKFFFDKLGNFLIN